MLLSSLAHWSVIKTVSVLIWQSLRLCIIVPAFSLKYPQNCIFPDWKWSSKKKYLSKNGPKSLFCKKTGKNYREIAKILKISLCSVHTSIRRYRETGQNTNRKRSDRPRKKNKRIDNKMYAISRGTRQKSASEIRAETNEHLDSPISLTIVKGRLKEKGMIGRIAVRKPLLRPVNK